MKPVRTYLSLARARNSSRLFLSILLLAQVFYLSVSTIRIPVPSKLLESTAQYLLPHELDMIINRATLIGFSNVEFENLVLKHNDKILLEIEEGSLDLQPQWSTGNPLELIEMAKLSKARIFQSKKTQKHSHIEPNPQISEE